MSESPWRYYLRFYQKYYPLIFLSVLVSIGQALTLLPIPRLVSYLFDTAVPNKNFTMFFPIGLLLIGLQLTNFILALWNQHNILKITKQVIKNLRLEILKKYYTFSRTYYTQVNSSNLHTLLVQDTLRIDKMSNALVAHIIPSLIICLGLT